MPYEATDLSANVILINLEYSGGHPACNVRENRTLLISERNKSSHMHQLVLTLDNLFSFDQLLYIHMESYI